MKLTAYKMNHAHAGWGLSPAPKDRAWMDHTKDRFAYRCLPLLIANQAGWVVTSPVGFSVVWKGFGKAEKAMKIKFDSEREVHSKTITSHFGYGILTFIIPYLFRTEPGISLNVRGLPNHPKVNCTALEGVVETDWSPFTFTMNWKIQLPFLPIRFEQGEPICFIQPMSLSLIEETSPSLSNLSSEEELKDIHDAWTKSRKEFNERGDHKGGWQKFYFQGKDLAGKPLVTSHHTSLQIKPFESDAS